MRDEFFKFRCTREEKERLCALAAAEGSDVSTFVRRRVFAGASEAPAPVPSLFDSTVSGTASAEDFPYSTSGVGYPD